MRALGLNLLAATCVVGLTVVTSSPAKSRPSGISLGFGQTNNGVVKEVGYRYWRYRYARPYRRHRYAYPPYHYRPYYRPFVVRPGRYFGVGPGAYECYGYDCDW
jgi:hypothetical protein